MADKRPRGEKPAAKNKKPESDKKLLMKVDRSILAAKGAVKQPSEQKNTVSDNRLKMLVTIVARNKAEFYTDLLQSFEVNVQMIALAEGTADAKMLALFGLNESEKAVILSFIQESKIPDALAALEEKFRTIKNGKGIAYTIPLSSMIGKLYFGFLCNNRMAVGDGSQGEKK